MPSLDKRMTNLEKVVENHLIESGGIRSDLKWVKKLLWFVLGSPFLLEALKHIHLAGKQ
jgi:hypothetical protein